MAVSSFKVKVVSKKELLLWFRDNISPNLVSFDELGNGVDFCLGIDMLFPGVIGNRVIELTENTEYSKRLNFRRLQTAFNTLNVKADIPIDGLIKGSFKDMFAFGIWFRAFYEANCKSLPKDLQKVRASHLKKWVKRKRQYESHKSKLYFKDLKRPSSDGNDSTLRNKDDCDSVDGCSEYSAILNGEVGNDGPSKNRSSDTQADMQSNTDSLSDGALTTSNLTSDETPDISVESLVEIKCEDPKEEEKHEEGEEEEKNVISDVSEEESDTNYEKNSEEIKPEPVGKTSRHFIPIIDIMQKNLSNNLQINARNSDISLERHRNESRVDRLGYLNKTFIPNPEATFTVDISPSSLSDSSTEKLAPSVIISEQINIELENYNIHLKESLEKLSKKYSLLCNAVNEVKDTLKETTISSIADEPSEDQFANIKMCCQRISKVLNEINI